MGVFDEIQAFIAAHRTCGRVSSAVDLPSASAEGYAVNVRCVCGETLERWVTADSARHDLIYSTLLCNPN